MRNLLRGLAVITALATTSATMSAQAGCTSTEINSTPGGKKCNDTPSIYCITCPPPVD